MSAAARGTHPSAASLARADAHTAPRIGVALTLLFVLVEYLRPQDWIGPLHHAPVAVVVAIPLGLRLAQYARPSQIRNPEIVLLALVAAFCMVWTPFAVNRFYAFETFKFLTLETFIVVAIVASLDSPARLRMLLYLLLAAFGAQAVFALGHDGRGFTAHFGDENDLALGMCVALPFAVFGAFAVRPVWARASLLVASALFVAGVVVSGSRGGVVALAATSAAMLGLGRRKLLTASTLVLGVALLVALAPPTYWAEMKTTFDSGDATRSERIRHWQQAKLIWRDNPLFGVGPGNAPWVAARYETYDTKLTHSLAGRAVHSLYFTLLAEFGLAGVALYGALAVLLARRCAAIARGADTPGLHAHAWGRAIACSLVAWLAGGLFLSVLYYPHFYFLIALALAISRLQMRGPAPAPVPRAAWATPLHAAPS